MAFMYFLPAICAVLLVLVVLLLLCVTVSSGTAGSCAGCRSGHSNKSSDAADQTDSIAQDVGREHAPVVVLMPHANIGNQMFQLAAAYAYARSKSRPVEIRGHKLRRPMLERAETVLSPTLRIRHTEQQVHDDDIGVVASRENGHVVSMTQFHYAPWPNVPGVTGPLVMHGNFQADAYFGDHQHALCHAFGPAPSLREQLRTAMLRGRSGANTRIIGVHARDGDYRKLAHIHTNMPVRYFTEALTDVMYRSAENIADDTRYAARPNKDLDGTAGRPMPAWSLDDTEVIVFSDNDAEAERVSIALRGTPANKVLDASRSAEMDIWAMASCDAVVAGNSSFSWWGAYLMPPKSRVALPSVWFDAGGPSDYRDVQSMARHDVRLVDLAFHSIMREIGVELVVIVCEHSASPSAISRSGTDAALAWITDEERGVGDATCVKCAARDAARVVSGSFAAASRTGSSAGQLSMDNNKNSGISNGGNRPPLALIIPASAGGLSWNLSPWSLEALLERNVNRDGADTVTRLGERSSDAHGPVIAHRSADRHIIHALASGQNGSYMCTWLPTPALVHS